MENIASKRAIFLFQKGNIVLEKEIRKNTEARRKGDDFLFKSFNCFGHRLSELGDRRSEKRDARKGQGREKRLKAFLIFLLVSARFFITFFLVLVFFPLDFLSPYVEATSSSTPPVCNELLPNIPLRTFSILQSNQLITSLNVGK